MNSLNEKITAIHSSGYRGVFVITGGGSGLLAALLSVPGASQMLLESQIPYCSTALTQFLGQEPERYCAERTARQMAMVAWQRASVLSGGAAGEAVFGFSITATLATNRSHRGEHRAFAAFQTLRETRSYCLKLEKGMLSREAEEARVTEWGISILAECLKREPRQTPPESALVAAPGWGGLLTGSVPYLEIALQPSETLATFRGILPGSFAPIHQGHAEMRRMAEEILGGEVALEMAVRNADKPPLDYVEINQRLQKMTEAPFPIGRRLILSSLPFFRKKAEVFPETTFVVGIDTLIRIADPRFHGYDEERMLRSHQELADFGTRFLVFGRFVGERFLTLDDIDLPPLLKSLCTGVSESTFRSDISSTQLRKNL